MEYRHGKIWSLSLSMLWQVTQMRRRMKLFSKLLTGLLGIVLLTGCIGEEYDFTPPSVTLVHSEMDLVEANIDWKSEEGYTKETANILQLAKEQPQVSVEAGKEDYLEFDHQDFAIKELSISVWQCEEETQLELKDGQSFNFPNETGEFVVEVNLVTDRGTAQYVGNIVLE